VIYRAIGAGNKKGMRGHASITANMLLNKQPFHILISNIIMFDSLRLPCASRYRLVFDTGNRVFLNLSLLALILEGKKESVKTPEASADLSDFLPALLGLASRSHGRTSTS
jgi:hypothetical protein